MSITAVLVIAGIFTAVMGLSILMSGRGGS